MLPLLLAGLAPGASASLRDDFGDGDDIAPAWTHLAPIANAQCVAAGNPAACCSGPASGTCETTYDASSFAYEIAVTPTANALNPSRAAAVRSQASFVDGARGKSVTERMWQRMRPVTDGAITVTLDQTREAMRFIAEKSRTIAEGAGALSLAAALRDASLEGPIVCVVSGGNVDLKKFAELVA